MWILVLGWKWIFVVFFLLKKSFCWIFFWILFFVCCCLGNGYFFKLREMWCWREIIFVFCLIIKIIENERGEIECFWRVNCCMIKGLIFFIVFLGDSCWVLVGWVFVCRVFERVEGSLCFWYWEDYCSIVFLW